MTGRWFGGKRERDSHILPEKKARMNTLSAVMQLVCLPTQGRQAGGESDNVSKRHRRLGQQSTLTTTAATILS